MKLILEFDLPDDQEEFEIHKKALAMDAMINEFNNYIRAEIKYKEPKHRASVQEIYQEWHERLESIGTSPSKT
jgi:hypothetical protein